MLLTTAFLGRYEGQWRRGEHEGHGRKDWGEGIVYVGEWRRGVMHGAGKYTMTDGYVMEGSFENDEFMG